MFDSSTIYVIEVLNKPQTFKLSTESKCNMKQSKMLNMLFQHLVVNYYR